MPLLDSIVSLLKGEDAAVKGGHPDLQVAVGALLVEAAVRNDVFEDREREKIEELLATRFHLAAGETKELLAAAEKANTSTHQLFGFIRKVLKQMDEAERVHLIEMLWEVAYADGVLDHHEDALIRKVAGLIYVSDYDRGAARRRVREKLGLDG